MTPSTLIFLKFWYLGDLKKVQNIGSLPLENRLAYEVKLRIQRKLGGWNRGWERPLGQNCPKMDTTVKNLHFASLVF